MRALRIGGLLAAVFFVRTDAARRQLAGAGLAILLMLAGSCAAAAAAQPRLQDAQLAVAWNQLAYDIAFAEDKFLTFKGHRAFAMMHLAMHDALNTIDQPYERYGYSSEPIAADPTAAAAQAAYQVLVSQYPDHRTKLDGELASWLDAVPKSALKQRGVELGKAAAAAILALRGHDGWDTQGTYAFASRPGQYQTTRPGMASYSNPGFAPRSHSR